jgi:hypothetical protein
MARSSPAALVGDIRQRTTSRVRECACTGSARKSRASIRCWCVRVKVGGTAVAMAQRRQHVHDKGLCSHVSRPKKGRAFARRWRAQCVGADGEPELGVRSSGQDQHDVKQGARALR